MNIEDFYKEIKSKLGTELPFSYQDKECRLYGKDAISKIIHLYREKMCNDIIVDIRNGELDTLDEVERELIYWKTK